MNILHYALGFPPYRSGGMTKFNMDLMLCQRKEGHNVALLWPGQMKFINHRVMILDRGKVDIDGKQTYIQSYELINPLPIPFDEGIKSFDNFTENCGWDSYEKVFTSFEPDIIHIHTFMGVHKAFFEVAKARKIRLVFTAHDFFPICPKVTMFRQGKICSSAFSCEECGECNVTALGIIKIKLLQSFLYRKLKDSILVKKVRQRHRNRYLGTADQTIDSHSIGTSNEYKELRNYYYSLIRMMDIIHFNSSVTKEVYDRFFNISSSIIINISHSSIIDHRKIKTFSEKMLRIRYLGPQSDGKGFYILKKALDKLWNKGHNFCLDVHFTPTTIEPYIRIHPRYDYSELEKIFDETDILIVPSIWYETFGFTVIEALSYGVPVIISDTVGAKDILSANSGIIIENIDADKIYFEIKNLTSERLKTMNKVINSEQKIYDIKDVASQITEYCYKH